jgi:hypothetical protein
MDKRPSPWGPFGFQAGINLLPAGQRFSERGHPSKSEIAHYSEYHNYESRETLVTRMVIFIAAPDFPFVFGRDT